MSATFTRTPVEHERKAPGTGGKPPVTRRPTGGGGDGDNWKDRGGGEKGPRSLLMRYRLTVFFALAGDLMFFVALVGTFFARQGGVQLDASSNFITDWRPLTIPPILWLNTAVLILSSATMEIARRHLFREVDVMEEWLGLGRPAVKRAAPWLVATALLGACFLAGQWIAWKQMWERLSFLASDPARYFFYLITGTHGAHLLLGILALLAALAAVYRLRRVEYRQIVVDSTAWYWHSMGLFWLFLFALLVFGQ